MTAAELRGQRVLILGIGIDVAAALDAIIAAEPAEVVVVDQVPEAARAALTAAGHAELPVVGTLDDAPPAALAVRSPGFSPYQPALAARLAAGLRTVTPLGLWMAARGARPCVAITGTKGKSSTSVLTAMALDRLGAAATVLGNIGTPPWHEDPATATVPVLEVSSYQAVDLPVTAPVAALTAIGEDHVSWHGSVAQYLADKARVFTAPLPPGAGDRWCAVPAHLARPAPFDEIDFAAVAVPPDDLRASNATVAAATALTAAGRIAGTTSVDLAELVGELLADYPDLPGRFSTVATIGDLEFVDDALASNPLGLAAGLGAVAGRAVAVIVGGADRGASLGLVRTALTARTRPTLVVAIDDARMLAGELAVGEAEVVPAVDLEHAVALAAERLFAVGPVGPATVLFSPGMPTPPDQGDWEDRSRRFRDAADAWRQRAVGAS